MYTDEKRPDGEYVYEVVPVIAVEEPKRKLPVWRRVLRAFLAISLFSMLWSAFVPMPQCSHDGPQHPHMRPALTAGPKLDYKFGPELRDFKIKQVFGSLVPSLVETVGVIVLKSHEDASNFINVHFDITSSDNKILDKIVITQNKHGLEFSSDPVVLVKQTVNITAYVTVPKGDKNHRMKTLQAITKGLDIKLAPSFKSVINGTYFSSETGSIISEGDDKMDVVFSPHFSAKTTSGSIVGRFPLGYGFDAETVSGHLHLNLSVAPWTGESAKIKTISGTGNTTVQFANELQGRKTTSLHKSATGDIKVAYPESWQGTVLGRSLGSVNIVGDSFKETDRRKDTKGNFLKGIKGDGNSIIKMISVSGDVAAIVGKWSDNPDKDFE